MEYYEPLTPTLRRKLNEAIDEKIAELKECEANAFTAIQLSGWQWRKNFINALPDGYPLPCRKG